jgi:xylulokinase
MSAQRAGLLAIDLGSTAIKVLIVDVVSGAPLALTRRSSGVESLGAGGAAEQDPETWWRAICDAVREALAKAGPLQILAIAADGHGPTLVPMRADGRSAAAATLWRDRRAVSDEVVLAHLLHRSGWLLAELPKARWFLRERAAAAAETAWLLSTWSALAFRMSGEAVASFWDPAQSLTPSLRAQLLSVDGGLDERALPPEVLPGTRIGALLAGPAAELGLPTGVPVIAGTNDGLAAVVGAGLAVAGRGVDVGGAAGGVGIAADPVVVQRVLIAAGSSIWSGPAPTPFGDLRILGGALGGTGRALDVLMRELAPNEDAAAELISAAAQIALGADGLTARHEVRADGVTSVRFAGRTDQHTPAHLVRAVMESGALAVAALLAPARAAGLPISEMWISGPATGAIAGPYSGASRTSGTSRRSGAPGPHAALAQMRADLLGVPVVVPRIPEAAVAGSAALAGLGVGAYASLREATDLIAVAEERLDPDPSVAANAAALLDRYVRA